MRPYKDIIEQINIRKHNLLLESVLTSKETRNIVDTTNQGLESEEKEKATTLLGIVKKIQKK